MRIQVEKQISDEVKETWTFNMFELNAVFIYWIREVKPKPKRKWAVDVFWDKYRRTGFGCVEEPVLPDDIKKEALDKAIQAIRVLTWDEFKSEP